MDRPEPNPISSPTWRPIGTWLVLVAGVFALTSLASSQVARTVPIESPGAARLESAAPAGAYPAPDFRLPSLDGQMVSPRDFLGKVVVMDLWATWCGPCRLQAQYLDQLHREYGDRVQFLAIDIGEDEGTVRRYVEQTPFPYPVLLDPSESVQRRYGATGLPTVLVVDPMGTVTFLHVGVADAATLRREIEAAGRNQGST